MMVFIFLSSEHTSRRSGHLFLPAWTSEPTGMIGLSHNAEETRGFKGTAKRGWEISSAGRVISASM